jgi:hypothetical protein
VRVDVARDEIAVTFGTHGESFTYVELCRFFVDASGLGIADTTVRLFSEEPDAPRWTTLTAHHLGQEGRSDFLKGVMALPEFEAACAYRAWRGEALRDG